MDVDLIRTHWMIQWHAEDSKHSTSVYGSLPYPVVNFMISLEVSHRRGEWDEVVMDYMALIHRGGVN